MQDLNDAEGVARWFATDPPPHEQAQVLDDLIGIYGNDRGLTVFAQGVNLASGTYEEARS